MCFGDVEQINHYRFFETVVDTHCVGNETVVRRINHFLFKYIILKIKLNASLYQLFGMELDSIEPLSCNRAD